MKHLIELISKSPKNPLIPDLGLDSGTKKVAKHRGLPNWGVIAPALAVAGGLTLAGLTAREIERRKRKKRENRIISTTTRRYMGSSLDDILEFKEKKRETHVPGVARKIGVGAGTAAGLAAGYIGGAIPATAAAMTDRPRWLITALSPRAKKDVVDEVDQTTSDGRKGRRREVKKGVRLRGVGQLRLAKIIMTGGAALGAYGGYKGARALLSKKKLTPEEEAKKRDLEKKLRATQGKLKSLK